MSILTRSNSSWFHYCFTSLLSTVLGVVLLVFFYSTLRRRRNIILKNGETYPPGPLPFPLLGNIPHLFSPSLTKILPKWSEIGRRYGKIISIYMGPRLTVTISDPKIMKEAFNNPHVNARPFVNLIKILHGNKIQGVGIQSGEEWKELSAFIVSKLNEYRFGERKKDFDIALQREARELISTIEMEMINKPISTRELFQMSVANVIWEILGSCRFDLNDPSMKKLLMGLSSLDTYPGTAFLELFFPRLSNWLSCISYRQEILDILQLNVEFAQNFVRDRRAHYQENVGKKHDLAQAFLDKIKDVQDREMENSAFYGERGYENMEGVVRDLLLAGTETATKTLCWLLLFLALHPDVQQKVQDEIDSVLQGKFPSLQDRDKMPYMDAVLHETMRKSSVIPLGVPHCTTEDTFVHGYFIPKSTPVASNIYAIHHDPDFWIAPESFRPERFLSNITTNDDGDGDANESSQKKKVIKHESFVVFSLGKRKCPGKQQAFSILFVFASSIFQRFTVSLDPGCPQPSMDARISAEIKPLPHQIIFTPRK